MNTTQISETWDEMVAAEPETGVYSGHVGRQAQLALLTKYPLAETEEQLRILELQRKLDALSHGLQEVQTGLSSLAHDLAAHRKSRRRPERQDAGVVRQPHAHLAEPPAEYKSN
jgi:hypothetical protein